MEHLILPYAGMAIVLVVGFIWIAVSKLIQHWYWIGFTKHGR